MPEVVLSVQNLNKFYKKFHAVKDVTFDVHKGEVVGFIGPNGSGKSTTMKCIASLLIPSSGTITVLDKDIVKDREEALSHQASLIEAPGLYLDIKGIDNLKLFGQLRNVSKERIQEVVGIIDIGNFINRKVSEYSLGMKQRLAIGIVLLSEPKFIILDEPTNGLDPTGVKELRELIQSLSKDGVSVLFSSHQLGEIEKIADRIICINNGELVPFESNVSDHKNYKLDLTGDMSQLNDLLKDIDNIVSIEIEDNSLKIMTSENDTLNQIITILVANNYTINDISNELISIEDLYLEIFGN